MIVVRAWPGHPKDPDAPHVVDGLRRVIVDDYDYSGLEGLGNVISLDWDVAVDREDLRAFAARAAQQPDEVLLGRNKLYNQPDPVWAAMRYTRPDLAPGDARQGVAWVTEGTEFCHLFGFGMVYLPAELVSQFKASHPLARMDDVSFSGWHYLNVKRDVRIDWSVRPVHLHFPVPEGGEIP